MPHPALDNKSDNTKKRLRRSMPIQWAVMKWFVIVTLAIGVTVGFFVWYMMHYLRSLGPWPD
ncbi:MAG TPA: hypothetical protein VGG19_08845 [Tepidisphaeraceae bacterium]|jgi:hypothetical protein